MKFFSWKTELDTGLELIDSQHRQYARFANAFFQICTRNSKPHPDLIKAFNFLHVYARDHLSTEEKLMAEYQYPERAAHIARHDYLRKWIDDTRDRVLNGGLSDDFLMKVNYVLVDWFQEHIKHVDHRLIDYLRRTARERNDGKLLRMLRNILPGANE